MPSKKVSKQKSTPFASRERSKSVGRSNPRSRSRTPTRSRSRSKVVTKRSRTPASESKIKRRRSPSSSSSSTGSIKLTRPAVHKSVKSIPDASGDKRAKPTPIHHESTPTRFSRRLVQKIDVNRSTAEERIGSGFPSISSPRDSDICSKLGTWIQERVCPSPLLASVCLVSLFPFIVWVNLLVLSPVAKESGYQLAGVTWPIDWHFYLDYRCHLFVLAYLMLNVLIARFIPLGFRPDSVSATRRSVGVLNGLFALAFFSGIYAFAQWCTWSPVWITKPSLILSENWFGLLSAAGNIGLVAALVVHAISRHTHRSQYSRGGTIGKFIVDFWSGLSVRPRWFGLDWKVLMLRPGSIALLLFGVTYLVAQWERFGRVSPALVATVAMKSWLVVDLFAFEYTLAHSFETLHEGFGYFTIAGVLLFPFLYSVGIVYLSSRPTVGRLYDHTGALDPHNCALIAFSIVLFLVGYWIYRASNNQKDLFRRQPNHATFGALDKISGPHSKRLLAGGWWGFVRHPNYLGDLMMAFAMALPSGFISIYPWFYPLFLSGFLLHRIWRTEYVNAENHGVVWNMYKKLVPNRLIPRIF